MRAARRVALKEFRIGGLAFRLSRGLSGIARAGVGAASWLRGLRGPLQFVGFGFEVCRTNKA